MAAIVLAAVLFCPPLPLDTASQATGPHNETKPHAGYVKPKVAVPAPEATVTRTAPKPTGRAVKGTATWYDYHPNQAAAGPGLRRALGSHWRGQTVTVCSVDNPMLCLEHVMLTDWCACGHGRVIDLHKGDFAKLAPTSAGVIPVRITR